MMRIFLMSVRFGIPHQLEKLFEQVIRIVRTGRSFGMVLNTECRRRPMLEAFDGVVVQIDVSNVDLVHIQAFRIHSETMILRGNFHLLALDIQYWVIAAMMPELQFERPPAECESHNLMAEADSKNRFLTKKSADILDGVVEGLG